MRQTSRQLDPRRRIQFPKGLPEVVLDSLGAEEQLRRDLAIGAPQGGQPCHLRLLGRQLIDGFGRTLARTLSRGLGTNFIQSMSRKSASCCPYSRNRRLDSWIAVLCHPCAE